MLPFLARFLLTTLVGVASMWFMPKATAQGTQEAAAILATLHPFAGESRPGVNTATLTGKVMCGYQGWFNCEGDGANRGWTHWTRDERLPTEANIKVDLWPDVTEYATEELYNTSLKHADGRVAQVFSSYNKATVQRHFVWMRDYGIDGAFVQRFGNGVTTPKILQHTNTVLSHCRDAANLSGRTYALMYDLTGLGSVKIEAVIEDWRNLRSKMKLGEDPAYLHHRGKPLVAVFGIAFSDKGATPLAESRKLIEALKADNCSVMLGTPAYWRELTGDAISDPALHEVMKLADVVSPWTIGRYGTVPGVAIHAETVMVPDIAWCTKHEIDYLPVLYPGFSWRNMYRHAPSNVIPRLKGDFYWTQFQHAKRAGATMLYVAMFDEVDEATAIFKCTNDAPKSTEASFVTYEGLPSDYYLQLTGAGGKLLRGELPPDTAKPSPKK